MTRTLPQTKNRKWSGATGIVAEGAYRLRESKWFKDRRAAIESELRARHAAELNSGDWWKRAAAEAKIQKEIQRELGKICSPYSLWSSC